MVDPIIHARNIGLSLGGEPVLDGVDITVDPGQVVVIIGPNGAGKTALLCCLAGGLHFETGQLTIDDRAMGKGARRRLSFLPQEPLAVEHLTGGENARFYTRLHPARTGRWRQLVDDLELADAMDARVRTYSGGMTRKLDLAIALDPAVPLYLLDEPTAGVDLTRITRLHDRLLAEASAGTTVVLTSHTPLDMELADTIVAIRDGRPIVTGPPDALLAALPDVLRVRGRIGRVRGPADDRVIGGRWYVRGDELRGFVRPAVEAEHLVRSLAAQPGVIDVAVEPPSFVDLFNFYTDRALPPGQHGTAEVVSAWT